MGFREGGGSPSISWFSSTPAGIGLKVTQFHADSVKNESARTKKTKGGLKGVYRRIFF